jgi:hypothetical protein
VSSSDTVLVPTLHAPTWQKAIAPGIVSPLQGVEPYIDLSGAGLIRAASKYTSTRSIPMVPVWGSLPSYPLNDT